MRRAFIALTVCFVFLSPLALCAAETAKGESFACPRSLSVEVMIKTQGEVNGWAAIPAKSTFTLAIKENVIQNDSLVCHYSNGTVDYNLAKLFPKGKKCFLGPNESFICQ